MKGEYYTVIETYLNTTISGQKCQKKANILGVLLCSWEGTGQRCLICEATCVGVGLCSYYWLGWLDNLPWLRLLKF